MVFKLVRKTIFEKTNDVRELRWMSHGVVRY